ncbi:MAG: glycosyltransferase family 4 protein [Ferrimicrobium sp.]
MRHVLITNDFYPKVGGIQAYLGEIYRRLDPTTFMVVTTQVPGAEAFDRDFPAPIVRLSRQLLPTPKMRRAIGQSIQNFAPELVVYDPIIPIGALGTSLGLPYALIAHGAEIRVPAHLPVLGAQLRRTVRRSLGVVAAGGYPADEVRKLSPSTRVEIIPPGIDSRRFHPAEPLDRAQLRERWMRDPSRDLVLFVSRLVPRKGADTLLHAMARAPMSSRSEVHLVGDGRDRSRLERIALSVAPPVIFHGRLSETDKIELYQAADLFVFPARDRWLGVEQEGFGIVILEAQACGLPVIVGSSGGTAEALAPEGGLLLRRSDARELWRAIEEVRRDRARRDVTCKSASAYVREQFDYDHQGRAYEAALQGLMHG